MDTVYFKRRRYFQNGCKLLLLLTLFFILLGWLQIFTFRFIFSVSDTTVKNASKDTQSLKEHQIIRENDLKSNSRKTSSIISSANIGNDQIKDIGTNYKLEVLSSVKKKTAIETVNLYNQPEYFQICNADSPLIGDFLCKQTVIKGSCAFFVRNTNHAKDICNSFNDKCRGFVIATVLKQNGRTLIVSYLKNEVSSMVNSKSTNFYVKRHYLKYIDWRTV